MSTFRTLLMAAGFTLLGAAGAVGVQAAAHGPRGGGHFDGQRLDHLAEALSLTEDQLAQVDDIKALVQAERQSHAPGAWADAVQQGTLDRAEVHAHIDARADAAHDIADAVIDLYDSLDEAQRATLSEKIDRFREGHERRRR